MTKPERNPNDESPALRPRRMFGFLLASFFRISSWMHRDSAVLLVGTFVKANTCSIPLGDEARGTSSCRRERLNAFELRALSFFRNSTFGIRHSRVLRCPQVFGTGNTS